MQKVNILLVDDRPANLFSLEALLSHMDYRIVCANSGEEALKALLVEDFAVIVLDIQMHGMDGFETARFIRTREKSKDTPIIFVSAFNQADEHMLKGYSLGAVDYLFKPIVPEIFQAKISVFADLFTKTQQLQEQADEIETANIELEAQLQYVQQLNEELQTANRATEIESSRRVEAEQANELKLKFLAMISHELRTPLTSIKGYATTLLATDVTWDVDSQRNFLTIIDEETDKLSELIDQLLDVSRLQAGTLRIQSEPCSLAGVIRTAMAQLESLTVQHQLVISVPSHLPPVLADAQRIASVVVNLVENASKYSPSGTQITISAAQQDANIQVNVIDEGPGIPIADREKVFEAFWQLDKSASQPTKGIGLGLAICKGLIAAHGGKIWVADVSSGTTISFMLPIVMNS